VAATASVLQEHRLHQAEARLAVGPAYRDQGLVFATPVGTPIDPSNLRRGWERLVRTAGLAELRFHDLRHAHATLLLAQGVHPKIVNERLGHSAVGLTLDVYSDVLPGLQEAATEELERLLEPALRRPTAGG
jgi:integrase